MTPEELFGEPTESLAAEAVWLLRRERGDYPGWEEGRAYLAEWQSVSEEEAEERILDAIRRGEVQPKLRGLGNLWGLSLSEDMADRLTRRHIAMQPYVEEEVE